MVFLIAVRDNDRGPFAITADTSETTYPSPLAGTNRLRQLERCRDLILTDDRHGPTYPCAVGVSVQMIESWILLAHNPNLTENGLPIFADKYQPTVKAHFAGLGIPPVPPQLKNRYDSISGNARRQRRREFNRTIAEQADLTSMAARSPSFAAFVRELEQLPKP